MNAFRILIELPAGSTRLHPMIDQVMSYVIVILLSSYWHLSLRNNVTFIQDVRILK